MVDEMSGIESDSHIENTHELQNPDLQVGNVAVWISEDPNGFDIDLSEEKESQMFQRALSRRQGPLGLDADQRKFLAGKMVGEGNWTGAGKAKAELDRLRPHKNSDASPENNAHIYEYRRQEYVLKGHKPKVGLRNIRRDGNTISFDTKPVSFPVYSNFSKEGASPEILDLAENAATCMSIITSDNKVLVQHRSIGNELYGDMPGASIAGMFDGTFDRSEGKPKGKLQQITRDAVLRNIKNEAREEMGMEEDDYNPVLAGLCEELKPVLHHEFLFTAQTHLTSDEIKQKALNTNRARKKELKPEDVEEKFEFIDATPESLYTLLVDFKCPLPPTHAAVFAATAYELSLKRDGKEAADDFRQRLEAGIKGNYDEIDRIVKDYYTSDPQRLNTIPDRFLAKVNKEVEDFKTKNPQAIESEIESFKQYQISQLPKRNPSAYNPAFLPKEQGLPEFDAEMARTGLSSVVE